MSLWTTLKFYILIIFYSVYHLILHFIQRNKVENVRRVLPPRCLTSEENGIHQYAKLRNSKLHYVERGSRSNKLIILLHGYPEFWYSWRFQLRNLSNYYWVVAIDLKGYGDSDKPMNQAEYNVNVLVDELDEFIRALGRSKCTLISHGMGGLIGWNYIQQYPNSVESFISISSPHPVSFLKELKLGRVNQPGWYFFSPLRYYPEMRAMKNDMEIFDMLFKQMIKSKRGNMTAGDVEAFKYTFARFEDWSGPINHIRTLILRQPRRNIKKLQIPTLFIIGNSDPFVSLEMICKSSEYVENFTLKIVEGGNHWLPQEMPNYVNSIIIDFLKVPESNEEIDDGSLFKKMIGAGKTVWSNSKDAVTRTFPKQKLSN